MTDDDRLQEDQVLVDSNRPPIPPYDVGRGQSVLVTGGAGYIGSRLVRDLLGRGYHVRVLDNLLYGGESIADLDGHPCFELIVDDFRSQIVVDAALRGAEAVVHLGAIVGDPACALDQDFTIQTNLEATQLLIAGAKRAGIRRFLFASTCSVYGASDGVLDETSALSPVSLYAHTKMASEEAVLAAKDDVFAPVNLRFATVYGVSHRPRFDLVVNLLTAKAVTEGQITIHGGEQWRPFVHVADIASSIVLALEAPVDGVSGETFNVGSTDENYHLSKIGELIADLVPSADVLTNDQIHDRRNYFVNFHKLRDRLGFRPAHTVRSGIVEVVDLVTLGHIGSYQDARYHNHRSLTEIVPERRGLVSDGD